MKVKVEVKVEGSWAAKGLFEVSAIFDLTALFSSVFLVQRRASGTLYLVHCQSTSRKFGVTCSPNLKVLIDYEPTFGKWYQHVEGLRDRMDDRTFPLSKAPSNTPKS